MGSAREGSARRHERGGMAQQTVGCLAGEAFVQAVESGRLDLPRPGSGRTRERWAAFAALAEEDLALARLAELGGPEPAPGTKWGVWAAQPPGPGLDAGHTAGGWRLRGTKQYCSGAW